MEQDFNIPEDIQKSAENFFGSNNVSEGIKLLKLSKTSISFSKGHPDNYFIVSGIVKSSKTHECKVVYKKRLEDTKEGPLKSNCDCHDWGNQAQCPHTAGLYLSFLLQIHYAGGISSRRMQENPFLDNEVSLEANISEYGTIIEGPTPSITSENLEPYTSLRYTVSDNKMVNFPIPEYFSGQILLCFDTTKTRGNNRYSNLYFQHKDERGKIHKKISIFQGIYLLNWGENRAYHLPREVRDFIQRIRGHHHSIDINETIGHYKKMGDIPSLQLIIDGKNFEKMEEGVLNFRLSLRSDKRINLVSMDMSFLEETGNTAHAPEFLKALCFEGGYLNTFKKKKDAYRFIASLCHSIIEKNDAYKKTIYLCQSKEKWFDLIRSIKEEGKFIYYGYNDQKKYFFDNHVILIIFTSLYRCFGEGVFRYSSYSRKSKVLSYKISSNVLFNGLGRFYNTLSPFGLSIFYNKNEISSWNSKMYFERRASTTKWFDLELNVTDQDLSIIKNANLETGVVLSKKGLVLLTKDQKDLLKFMKKYIKHGSKNEPSEKLESSDEGIKKFYLPFSRNRIFELFEVKKLGVGGTLTQEEEELCERLINLKGIPSYPLSSSMERTLRPYQKTGHNWLRFLYENHLGACLADDMGLGKTLQTIAFICSVVDSIDRVLIVCPVSILLNWEKEFKKFSQLNIYIYHGGERKFPDDVKIILTSYGIMKKEIEETFENKQFDILVLDEVQHLKNIRSLGAFAARKISAGFRICLTGTPVENDLAEFYNILDLSMPGLWGELQLTKNISTKQSHLYAKKTAGPFVLRRTKDQVLTELPPKQEHNVFLNFSEEERRYYETVLVDIKKRIILSPKKKKYGEILKGILQLRQRCLWQGNEKNTHHSLRHIHSTKIDFLMDQLEQILKEHHQVIIFSQFTTYLSIIEGFLHQREWVFAKIDGTQGIKRRQKEVDSFQKGEKNIFLISLKAGGVGLNLTAASYVFLMDPWWNPAVEQQAIDRAHRIGQKNTLIVYKPIIKDSIEEKVLELKKVKKELFNDLLDKENDHFFKGNLSMKDFEHFFESTTKEPDSDLMT